MAPVPHKSRAVPKFVATRSELLHSQQALPLHSPSQTSADVEGAEVGERRARRTQSQSAYTVDAPWATRARARGHAGELERMLREGLPQVRCGLTLLELVADGSLWGWRLRVELANVVGEPLAVWDRTSGRTTAERVAIVERALVELGAFTTRKGGWQVSR